MKTENWYGNDIRFIEKNGEWWAIFEDILEALHLGAFMETELDPEVLERVHIDGKSELVINELGIYQLLIRSRRLEARKFRRWSAKVMQKLRRTIGLEGYEVMKITEPETQAEIDCILDSLYYDEETGHIMQSVTVQNGDVEQVIFK